MVEHLCEYEALASSTWQMPVDIVIKHHDLQIYRVVIKFRVPIMDTHLEKLSA